MKSLAELAGVGVDRLKDIKAKDLDGLAEMGISTIADLVTYYPRKYIDRTNQAAIGDLAVGEQATVLATVRKVSARRSRQGKQMAEIDLFDGTSYLHVVFFNQAWRAQRLPEGTQVTVFGKVDVFRGRRQMTNPVVDLVGDQTGRIVPVYRQSEKSNLMTWDIAKWISQALRRVRPGFDDPLPPRWRDELDLVSRDWAFRHIHEPEGMGDAQKARQRLAFDELLRLQLVLVMRKRAVEREAKGIHHHVNGELMARFRASLPFSLTAAQDRAIAEIAEDMAGPHPMHRLLQGDVGAGKTLVAVAALLTSVDGGHQGALMAPTEVLAEQHHAGISKLLAGLSVTSEATLFAERPLEVALLTNRVTGGERTRLLGRLASGEVDILIGTHALLTETVTFEDLGCVVIDEQHRFGVEQRSALREKGPGLAVPDVLVMTATPIPRTAAMTVYGDLDTTILDELPPGRTPITTRWARGPLEEAEAWGQVRQEVAAGRQAYVVCPLVGESEKVQAKSATEEFERLGSADGELHGLRLGLLHGQMAAADKESVMDTFRAGELDVLVSTTVIEVGVDVANATVMVIENAERFGIAQLHQLRGRVGRSAHRSWCYLLSEPASGAGADGDKDDTQERLSALERTTDGFELAEVDLELRGEGTILGVRQKGATDLKLASLRRDKELVAVARRVAFELVDDGAGIAALPGFVSEISLLLDEADRAFLFKS